MELGLELGLRSWLVRPRGEREREEGVASSGNMRWARVSNAFLGGEASREEVEERERGGGACRVGMGVADADAAAAAWNASRRCWRMSSNRGMSVR